MVRNWTNAAIALENNVASRLANGSPTFSLERSSNITVTHGSEYAKVRGFTVLEPQLTLLERPHSPTRSSYTVLEESNPTMPEDFEITVHTQYLPERSSENHFVFVYFIRIENRGHDTAQLLERHWLINDGEGRSMEVHGAGVVGEQPRFAPGGVFEYNSSVAVNSTPGVMRGTYTFALEDGERFEVPIPPFALRLPENLRELN